MSLTEKFGLDSREREQRKRFIHLEEADVQLLQGLRPFMEKHVDAIIEEFYDHLLKYADARAFFPDQAVVRRVKSMQREYLLTLCEGRLDENYFERRLEIGVVHERIGLVPKWYIGSYSNFMWLIFPRLAREYRFSRKQFLRAVLALVKLMNLDEQLAIDTYIGSMMEKLSMVESLRTLGREIQEVTAVLAGSGAEISSLTDQLAASATQTAASISETTATVEETRQAAQVAQQKAGYVAERAKKTSQVAQTGKKSVEDTIEGMNRVREQVEAIAESVVRLSEQSQAIGEIIATVNDLADQSNLLAVNASIEAAKAGDYGKGFGVVAQEIKSLAERSRQATAQVRSILSEIQKSTSTAVLTTEQGSKAVAAGVKQSEQSGESIRILAENIAEAAQAATQIAASSQQQLVGTEQVALALENIKQASAQNVASTKQAEAAAQNLHQVGQKLKQLVEQYKM